MANISSLSGTTNRAMSSLRGYGGLASGLDRDELIAGMTSGTQTKITKQQQAKTKLQWQQEAYRNISNKMIGFADKYTATMSSSTNLFSDAFWGSASTSVVGANSKFISVIGANKTAAANVSILGVKQLATNTKIMSSNSVSDRVLTTGTITTGKQDVSTVAGKNLQFTVGDKNYYVSLPYEDVDKGKYDSIDSVAQALKEAMDKIEVKYDNSKTGKLSDFVEVGVKDGNLTLAGKGGNSVKLKGGTALEALGFKAQVDATKENSTVKGLELGAEAKVGFSHETDVAGKKFEAWEKQSFAQRMGGKSLTFNYNGNRQSIELPTQEEIEKAEAAGESGLKFLADKLQDSLNAVYGKNRVKVEVTKKINSDGNEEGQLTFKTTTPEGQPDNSSTLSIADGSASLMAGKGGMGIIAGESNRLNLNTSLKNSGLAGYPIAPSGDAPEIGVGGKYSLNINGKDIEFTEDDSLSTIMDRINKADAGVKISYMSTADKFVVEATDGGASGEVKLSGSGAIALFGEEIDSTKKTEEGAKNAVTKGQDAIVAVRYAGSDEVVNLTRGSNSFDIDGLNITVKGTFGEFDADNKLINEKSEDAVTFETNVSSEKMVSAIADMVKEYNEILELVNSHVSTRPDSDYFPLTDEQKKEMSESEIKLWEEKAKAGILFGSSELRSLSDDLRWMIDPKDQQFMAELGISVSSNWQDNGKLVFDETKFKAALEKDPDAVKAAFVGEKGIATNLKNTMNKYVSTMGATKGILIEKAGSTKAPTSVLKNSIQSEIDDVDKILESLKARLKSEQDRYISQFTQLETLISQMNSQSSYLSGMGF